jgi:hypothetical protein
MSKWKVFGEVKLDLGDQIKLSHIDVDQEVVMVDGERLTETRAEQGSEEIMEAYYKHHGMRFTPRKLDHPAK